MARIGGRNLRVDAHGSILAPFRRVGNRRYWVVPSSSPAIRAELNPSSMLVGSLWSLQAGDAERISHVNPVRRSTRRRTLAVLAATLALVTAACGSSNPLGGGEISGDLKSIAVGSADFTESKIIAEIYAQTLEANGFNIRRQFGIGSRETYIPAVQDHSIDLIPEYTGNLLQYFDAEATATTPDAVLLALLKALPGDLSILYPSPAEDKDTLAVTDATAQKWNLKSIADLAK